MDRDDVVNGEGGFLKRRLRIETDLLAIDGFSFVLGFQSDDYDGRWSFSFFGYLHAAFMPLSDLFFANHYCFSNVLNFFILSLT